MEHTNKDKDKARMTTIPTIKFMSLEEYNNFKKDPSFENFEYYTENMISYFSQKQLKKQFNTRKKIKAVIVYMKYSKHFIPKQNKLLTYENPVCVNEDWEGAFCQKLGDNKFYVSNHPYGDCLIVI